MQQHVVKPLTLGQPQQSFVTENLGRLPRPELMARVFMAVVSWAERLNVRFSRVGNPPVYDNAVFPWTTALERDWPAIRAELGQVLTRQSELPSVQDISADVRSISQDAGWKTFFLVGYGLTAPRNIAQCPNTWRALQAVPGLKTAMFSIFEPGKHLPPHRGPYNGVLRLHLGLIVPEPQEHLAIRVDRQICHWREGQVLVFDDAYEHEAWNHTGQTRVVLFVDFTKPLRFPANLVNWLILNLSVFTPFVREGADNHRIWEARFYGAKKEH